jgi:hypothetical protein
MLKRVDAIQSMDFNNNKSDKKWLKYQEQKVCQQQLERSKSRKAKNSLSAENSRDASNRRDANNGEKKPGAEGMPTMAGPQQQQNAKN